MKSGLDVIASGRYPVKTWGRCALISNQASTTLSYAPAWKIFHDLLGPNLTTLFGPQHGFESTVQENMIETGHGIHRPTGLPVYSLYSETREPTEQMLANVDTIVVDLLVSGCRIYTYKYTMAAALRAAKKYGKRVVVLDRHNPLSGTNIEGNALEPDMKSFVGEFAIPMRHGLTMGEAGKLFNQSIGADLEIVKLEGWDPKGYWKQYDRDWILTSPNLQSFDAAAVFPGMVLFEGTNVSEGRGTTLPFQLIGAAYIDDADALTNRVLQLYGKPEGFVLRPTSFQPAFHKFKDEVCNGFQIHVTDVKQLASYRLGLCALRAFAEMGGKNFKWREPPYEYEYNLLPIQILFGAKDLHKKFMAPTFDLTQADWAAGCVQYIDQAASILLYDRQMKLIKRGQP